MFVDQIDQIDRIMTLPQIVTQINELVESKTSSAYDLHCVIKTDPALSTRILRLVNSAYYGLPGRVGSVEKAVILLGVTAVRNLAIAAGVEQMFRRIRLAGPLTGKDLWMHCLSVAACARELGKRANMAHLDEVFMAGMVHDVGILAAAQVAPQDFVQVVQACMGSNNRWNVAEMEILGIEHAVAGAQLAERWHFPGYMVEMIANHHRWPECPESSDLRGMIYLADCITSNLGMGFSLTAHFQTIDPVMMAERTGLCEQDIAEVYQSLPSHLEELGNRLRI